jgi:hypothetical protein
MKFVEPSDEQWEFVKPYIPPQPIVWEKADPMIERQST